MSNTGRISKNILLINQTGAGGGGVSYSYEVSNYSDLPVAPPNAIKIKVTLETISNVIVEYSEIDVAWKFIYGTISSVVSLPTTPIYNSGGKTVNIATDAIIINNGVSPYTAYRYDGGWIQFKPSDFVDQTIYANASALQTAYPAASNTNLYGLATESLVTKLYKSNGSAWLQIAPTIESNSIVGSYAGDTAVNTAYTNGSWSRRTGDLYTDSSGAGTTVKRWSGSVWQIYRLDWDGTTAGQLVSSLPSADIYTGAIATVGTRAFEYSGSAWVEQYPDVSVTTFANLPLSAPTGYLALVTAETGLTSALVRKTSTSGEWAIERVTCTYATYSAIEWGSTPGQWYNTGGITVVTAEGGIVNDTTNKMAFYWNATNSVFVPYAVYVGTIAGYTEIKGDSAAPSGWVISNTVGTGTSTATTSGGKFIQTTTNAGGSTATASATYSDASLLSSTNVYIKAMIQQSAGSGGNYGNSFTLTDGTDGYDFGTTQAVTGVWYDLSLGSAYTAQTAGTQNITSAEVFFEFQKIGTFAQFRLNGGRWSVLSGATARNAGGKSFMIQSYCTGASTTSTTTVRYLSYMRY